MILISNNVRGRLSIPRDAVIRINMAYYGTLESLALAVKGVKHKVFLDYPQDRIKPPAPVLDLEDAIYIMEGNKNIRYFAISNAEDPVFIGEMRLRIPKSAKLVPKIETRKGICFIKELIAAAETDIVMLDKEDLYFNTKREFADILIRFRKRCKELKIELLELEGVIFYTASLKEQREARGRREGVRR